MMDMDEIAVESKNDRSNKRQDNVSLDGDKDNLEGMLIALPPATPGEELEDMEEMERRVGKGDEDDCGISLSQSSVCHSRRRNQRDDRSSMRNNNANNKDRSPMSPGVRSSPRPCSPIPISREASGRSKASGNSAAHSSGSTPRTNGKNCHKRTMGQHRRHHSSASPREKRSLDGSHQILSTPSSVSSNGNKFASQQKSPSLSKKRSIMDTNSRYQPSSPADTPQLHPTFSSDNNNGNSSSGWASKSRSFDSFSSDNNCRRSSNSNSKNGTNSSNGSNNNNNTPPLGSNNTSMQPYPMAHANSYPATPTYQYNNNTNNSNPNSHGISRHHSAPSSGGGGGGYGGPPHAPPPPSIHQSHHPQPPPYYGMGGYYYPPHPHHHPHGHPPPPPHHGHHPHSHQQHPGHPTHPHHMSHPAPPHGPHGHAGHAPTHHPAQYMHPVTMGQPPHPPSHPGHPHVPPQSHGVWSQQQQPQPQQQPQGPLQQQKQPQVQGSNNGYGNNNNCTPGNGGVVAVSHSTATNVSSSSSGSNNAGLPPHPNLHKSNSNINGQGKSSSSNGNGGHSSHNRDLSSSRRHHTRKDYDGGMNERGSESQNNKNSNNLNMNTSSGVHQNNPPLSMPLSRSTSSSHHGCNSLSMLEHKHRRSHSSSSTASSLSVGGLSMGSYDGIKLAMNGYDDNLSLSTQTLPETPPKRRRHHTRTPSSVSNVVAPASPLVDKRSHRRALSASSCERFEQISLDSFGSHGVGTTAVGGGGGISLEGNRSSMGHHRGVSVDSSGAIIEERDDAHHHHGRISNEAFGTLSTSPILNESGAVATSAPPGGIVSENGATPISKNTSHNRDNFSFGNQTLSGGGGSGSKRSGSKKKGSGENLVQIEPIVIGSLSSNDAGAGSSSRYLPEQQNQERGSRESSTSKVHQPKAIGLSSNNSLTESSSDEDLGRRRDSFTPLSLERNNSLNSLNSSPNPVSLSALVPNLSWSITGDTPPLGEMSPWCDEEENQSPSRRNSLQFRPTSNPTLSLWKDDIIEGDSSSVKSRADTVSSDRDFDMLTLGTLSPNSAGKSPTLPFFFENDNDEERENVGYNNNNNSNSANGNNYNKNACNRNGNSHNSRTSSSHVNHYSESGHTRNMFNSSSNTTSRHSQPPKAKQQHQHPPPPPPPPLQPQQHQQQHGPLHHHPQHHPPLHAPQPHHHHQQQPSPMHHPANRVGMGTYMPRMRERWSEHHHSGMGGGGGDEHHKPYDNRPHMHPPRDDMMGGGGGGGGVCNIPPPPQAMQMFSIGQQPPNMPGQNDRVRNLRGNPNRMMPPHHVPPHHMPMHHPDKKMDGGIGPWQHQQAHNDISGMSKRKCIPMKPPIPSKFQGDIEKMKDAPVPDFTSLVNFPVHMATKQIPSQDGMRNCVMCGKSCPCSASTKNLKKGDIGGGNTMKNKMNNAMMGGNPNISQVPIIPTQNKGLCTACDVNVWVVTSTRLDIKWCKGCKNFRPWAAFGDKGLATKCVRCRERQREKYALQKEEKEKSKLQKKIATKD